MVITRLVSLLALALALTTAAPAQQKVAGVPVPDTVEVAGSTLVRNGVAIRKKLFVSVYVGSLYVPTKKSTAEAIFAENTPRRMVMHFVHDVDKAKMVEAWQEGLGDNTPKASAEVRKAFETLESWMEDIKSGNEIVITYVPSQGTIVDVNGATKGTLKGGKPVADAILATWIGPKPGPGESFKNAILGH